jgi:hypothetical protein
MLGWGSNVGHIAGGGVRPQNMPGKACNMHVHGGKTCNILGE